MPIIQTILKLKTESRIEIYNVTPEIQTFLTLTQVQNGQVLVFSRHTTTALTINEYEPRLLEDTKTYLRRLAPESERYLHNDLQLRANIPDDEPMNAHSHLMAMTLSTSEIIPVIDGKLGLGTYQSILFVELDGPRQRTLLVQVCGE